MGQYFETMFMQMPDTGCECCRTDMTGSTTTISCHKWTRKEIEEELIRLAEEMLKVRWYDRADVRRRIKHWVGKLNKYKEAEEEFNFKN